MRIPTRLNSISNRLPSAPLRVALTIAMTYCSLGLTTSAEATIVTVRENWERLEFEPGDTFRVYSAAEFNKAIPKWQVNTNARNGYGVEHQHSLLTWHQPGTNNDFLELDRQFEVNEPQIFTGYSTAKNQGLESIDFSFQAAGRPDLNSARTLALYGRENEGQWKRLDSFSIFGGNDQYPEFSLLTYTLQFSKLFTGTYEFGFGCTNCGSKAGFGPLLGTVTAAYDVRSLPRDGGGGTAVPEPSTLLLVGTAIAGIAKRRNCKK